METRNEDAVLFVCDCSSREHQIIVWHDEGFVYASIHLVKFSFGKRLRYALRYVMGYSCKYGNFEEFIWSRKDIGKLEKLVDVLKMKEK